MRLAFTKMQGAGNDFVVIDGVTQSVELTAAQLKRIADRHRGIGCDQILVLTPPDDPDADFRYTIFNADGSRAGAMWKRRSLRRPLPERTAAHAQARDRLITDGEPILLSISEDNRVTRRTRPSPFSPLRDSLLCRRRSLSNT